MQPIELYNFMVKFIIIILAIAGFITTIGSAINYLRNWHKGSRITQNKILIEEHSNIFYVLCYRQMEIKNKGE